MDQGIRQVRLDEVVHVKAGDQIEVIGHIDDGSDDGSDFVLWRLTFSEGGVYRFSGGATVDR